MATVQRQPTTMDYVSPTQFKFTITQLPKVEFFVTNCNLPGISLGETVFPTPFKPIPVQGDELTFDNLSIGFQVSENLENYIELHNWLLAIGFPKSRQQFATHRSTTSNTSNTTRKDTTNDIGKVQRTSISGIVMLLSKQFSQLIILAIVLAVPIAYFIMNTWLGDFEYRVEINWLWFVVSAIAAMA